jgi:hypothetical protein
MNENVKLKSPDEKEVIGQNPEAGARTEPI